MGSEMFIRDSLYAGPGPEVTFIIVAGVVLILSSFALKLSGVQFIRTSGGLVSHG